MKIKAVFDSCEAFLKAPINSSNSIGGGSISDARVILTSKGKYFLKTNSSADALALFESEVNGLKLLAGSNSIRIPQVLYYSQVENTAFVLLEFIDQGLATAAFWKEFGYSLANLHRNTSRHFGLATNNFIGSLPQRNNLTENWVDFFINERMLPQIELATRHAQVDSVTISKFEQLFKKLKDIFPVEKPSLIHGDLWNGNFLYDSNEKPVLIDPSVAYAHREMDLAMSRLFGGFDRLFYESYNEAFPLQNGFDNRVEIYQLYYLMVHVNLFGGNYLSSVKSILSRFVD